jgi:predicted DNA-binding transcriptional regulator AlpA
MRLLNQKDLPRKGIDYHPSHLFKLVRAGKFPKPDKILGKLVWDEDIIDAWIKERIEESRAAA